MSYVLHANSVDMLISHINIMAYQSITGADFHRAMEATAPAEKLLRGRSPVRNWTRRTISSLILCRKLHLFLGKSTKTAATRAALFDSNMHLIVCWLGLREKGEWKGREEGVRPLP